MTTEEKIEYLSKAIMTLGEEGDCKTAFVLNEIRTDLRTEQLPDNLDKAAEDFVWEVMENDEDGISELSKKLCPSSKISDYYDALAEFFKAGARWMAEQGNSIQCEIDWYDSPYPDFAEEQQVELCKGFKPGDKVIVQIRKAE